MGYGDIAHRGVLSAGTRRGVWALMVRRLLSWPRNLVVLARQGVTQHKPWRQRASRAPTVLSGGAAGQEH
ncbi:hypothetical protein, partial [Escherichia coli]|uniref:hypothetical protein n=1 Tax=Escherichia coli TaxID=562 RepID=UPI001EDB4004